MQFTDIEDNVINNVINAAELNILAVLGISIKLEVRESKQDLPRPRVMLGIICKALDMGEEEYHHRSRKTDHVHLRTIATLFINKYYPEYGTGKIGQMFGGFDHTTIMNYQGLGNRLLKSNDPVFLNKYNNVLKEIAKWIQE